MKPPERWLVLGAGIATMMCVGTAYSWSLFSRPCSAFFGWSSLQVSFVFALLACGFGVGAILGGFLHDRFGPRNVTILGVVMFGGGTALAGLGTASLGLPWLYFCFGAIAGVGGGIVYVTPGATATKWFPEERGLANGLILMGFGAGSLFYNNLVAQIPSFARAAQDAQRVILARNAAAAAGTQFISSQADTADIQAVMGVFLWSGIAFIAIGVLCALILHKPPPGYSVAKVADMLAHEREFTPREMLRSPAFLGIWTMVAVDTIAGFAILGNAVPLYSELTGADATTAGIVYGWLSIFNGIGRLAGGWVSDLIGRKRALVGSFVAQALAIVLLAHLKMPVLVCVDLALVLLFFGSILGIAPAMTADYFGTKAMGENYGLVISAASIGGLAGPTFVGLLEDTTGGLRGSMVPLAMLLLAGAFLPLITRKPAAVSVPA
jgi:MFS transporter, OFA family, oxalate/formate antiporter